MVGLPILKSKEAEVPLPDTVNYGLFVCFPLFFKSKDIPME